MRVALFSRSGADTVIINFCWQFSVLAERIISTSVCGGSARNGVIWLTSWYVELSLMFCWKQTAGSAAVRTSLWWLSAWLFLAGMINDCTNLPLDRINVYHGRRIQIDLFAWRHWSLELISIIKIISDLLSDFDCSSWYFSSFTTRLATEFAFTGLCFSLTDL